MTISEKYKGKIVKKVSNTGISKEEYNNLISQVNELTKEVDDQKQQLTDKLVSEGLNVSIDNTFEELINNISLGKKCISGTTMSCASNTTTSFKLTNGNTISGIRYLSLNLDIDFTPSYLIFTNNGITICNFEQGICYFSTGASINYISMTYAGGGKFHLPCYMPNTNTSWIIYE